MRIDQAGQLIRVEGLSDDIAASLVRTELVTTELPGGGVGQEWRKTGCELAQYSDDRGGTVREYGRGMLPLIRSAIAEVEPTCEIVSDQQLDAIDFLEQPAEDDPAGVRSFTRATSSGLIDCRQGLHIHDVLHASVTDQTGYVSPIGDGQVLRDEPLVERTFLVLNSPSQRRRVVSGLEARGVRVSDMSEDDAWRYWLAADKQPEQSKVLQHVAETTDESDPERLAALASPERNTPHVVIGNWRDLAMLFHEHDPWLSSVFVADPLSAFYKANHGVLRSLPATTRLFGIAERLDEQPVADRERLRSLYGESTLAYVGSSGAAVPPRVSFRMMPFKQVKRRGAPLSAPLCELWATRRAETHAGRNKRIGQIVRQEVNAFGCGPQSIAVTAGSTEHALAMLDRLNDDWKAVVLDGDELPERFEHLRTHLIRVPACGRLRADTARAIRNYPRLVVPTLRTSLVGHRRTWVRTDLGDEGLKLTGAQQIARDGQPVRIVDVGDTWLRELSDRTVGRFGAYRSAGWTIVETPPTRLVGRKQRPPKTPRKIIPYAARPRGRGRQSDLVVKARQKVSTLRLAHRVPLISAVADQNILLGALTELATSDQCGDAAGVDEVCPSMIGRSERLQVAKDVGSILQSGHYRPAPVRKVEIAKCEMPTLPDDWREIGIPTVVDRLVQKSLVWTIRKHFKPRARYADKTPCSWAATGLGRMRMLADVKRRVDRMVADGQEPSLWTGDIEKAFDRVRPSDVMRQIGAGSLNLFSETRGQQKASEAELELRLGESHSRGFPKRWRREMRRLRTLVERVLRGHANSDQGIIQGGPFSPLALDLLLDGAVDEHMMKLNETKSLWFWRYVDDMLLLGPSAQTCKDAVDEVLLPQLALQGMNLKSRKTQTADLNVGETIEALGLSLRLHDGELVFQAPADAAETAAAAAGKIWLGEASLHRFRLLLEGLLGAYSPVLGEDQQFGRELRNAVLGQSPSWFSPQEYQRIQSRAVSSWQRVLHEAG